MELKKHITDERTGISYTLCGDYYLPDLKLPEEKSYDLGRFGRAKFRYLQKCHRVLLINLRINGNLNEYLHGVDVQCEETFSRLVIQLAEREGVTEQLKAEDMLINLCESITLKNVVSCIKIWDSAATADAVYMSLYTKETN